MKMKVLYIEVFLNKILQTGRITPWKTSHSQSMDILFQAKLFLEIEIVKNIGVKRQKCNTK